MFKNILILIFIINFLTSCDYKPIYSSSNKSNYKIIITDFSGDKKLNRYIIENLKRNSQRVSDDIVNIQINTQYTKETLAKNTLGTTTNYQAKAITRFKISKNETLEELVIKEKFNFQKITDNYEEKSYEQTIKRNLAESISQKLILRLSTIK